MIPLAIPNISGNEGAYLQECVRSNFVSSVGPYVSRFEEMGAAATGAAHAVATSAGTTGLHLALTAVGVRAGDLVITPAFTFIASANAISHCAASPWLFDVSPRHWTLDAQLVRSELERHAVRRGADWVHRDTGRRLAAIMPVHTLGHPSDMDALAAVAAQYDLPLVADAAAALGARYKGRAIGSLACLSVLSFNGNKTVTAGGGGMVVGDDAELMRWVRHLSTTARAGIEYEHDAVGFNYRMTNLQAAVGCAQMERLDEFVAAKQHIDARYREELRDIQSLGLFPVADWSTSACWFSGVTVMGAHTVRALCARLRESGIEARTFWKPIHLQAPYAGCPRTSMSVSEEIWHRILTLPCSTQLTVAEQSLVISTLRGLLT
jgi:dTDP-4-amino-4,6-dideoxygalactose transaminase